MRFRLLTLIPLAALAAAACDTPTAPRMAPEGPALAAAKGSTAGGVCTATTAGVTRYITAPESTGLCVVQ